MNNDGDSLAITNDTGVVAAEYTYGSEAGDDQSLTRSPDITGPEPLVKHSLASGSSVALFSPGTRLDGVPFGGCSALNP
jgi:hypothetical protein